MLAVASGLCRHVLCYRTLWESSYAALVREGKWAQPAARATGMTEFLAPFGAMSAANWIAVQASHYFHRYGGDRTTLGWIAVNARANAARNPEAVYREPFTIDDYLAARLVTTPFGLYDCDVPVDGAVAVIVSAVETAADRPRPPVLVEAVGTQILERLSWDQDTLSHEPQTKGPSRHLWSRTSVRPDEVDLALLYDGFTFNAVSWLESLGFCEPGGARDFIDEGRGIALGGRLPVNPHGGQLSAGRLHGFGHVREAMLQLRGEAGGPPGAGRPHRGGDHRRRRARRRAAVAASLATRDRRASRTRSGKDEVRRGTTDAAADGGCARARGGPVHLRARGGRDPGRLGSRGDQGRARRAGRRAARPDHRPRGGRDHEGEQLLPDLRGAQPGQAQRRPGPGGARGQGGARRADQAQRRLHHQLPAGRAGQAAHQPRGRPQGQPRHHLRARFRLRRPRPRGQQGRLRHDRRSGRGAAAGPGPPRPAPTGCPRCRPADTATTSAA